MAIKIVYEKQEYLLEYTRESVRQMENSGFNITQLGEKPANMIPQLFYGAFMKNHKGIKRSLVDEIFESIGDGKDELIIALGEMYADTIKYLTNPSEKSKGNATWEVM